MSAVLVIFNDIDPAAEAHYESWYWQDHLPQRWELFGRLSARRYRRIGGEGREYFTFYEVPGLATFASPEYQATLREPTQGTRRIMPHFRNMVRSLCRPVLDTGRGTGGVVAAMALEPDEATASRLSDTLAPHFDRLIATPCITRCRLWQTDIAATRAPNPESGLRGNADAWIPWIVVVEGSSPERVASAAQEVASDPLLASARPPASPPRYALLNALP
jgi:hypothetical protein